jgi:hypothetical protein
MSHTYCVSKRTYLRLTLLAAGSCLLMASSCPTSDPFPPPPLRAPVFTAIGITGIKISDAYRPAVRLQWDLRGKDSLPVSQYAILRKKQSTDSAFFVMHYAIPDSVFEDYDVLLQNDVPAQGVYSKIGYRIFAVDTMGRSGDTSAVDSIRLCWAPIAGYPTDTLKQNLFKWYTIQYMAGYFTYLYLWNETGLCWTSPMPNEPSYGHETLDSFFVHLPDSLYPLATGDYWYGLKVEIPGENIQTLAIQEFHAP